VRVGFSARCPRKTVPEVKTKRVFKIFVLHVVAATEAKGLKKHLKFTCGA
jgi:hypothetical protein